MQKEPPYSERLILSNYYQTTATSIPRYRTNARAVRTEDDRAGFRVFSKKKTTKKLAYLPDCLSVNASAIFITNAFQACWRGTKQRHRRFISGAIKRVNAELATSRACSKNAEARNRGGQKARTHRTIGTKRNSQRANRSGGQRAEDRSCVSQS